MKVLITSRTKWGTKYCIGGLEIKTGDYVRLMTTTGDYQPYTCRFHIGQIWKLKYTRHPDKPPHIEDVRINSSVYVKDIHNINDYILKNCVIWKGDYNQLYDGHLRWTWKGAGFIGNPKKLPSNSVGFWISDKDLIWDGKKYYTYKTGNFGGANKIFSYRGEIPPIKIIPAGTLIRVSLAKWLPSKYVEDRCYAQLSGWY